jgi:hypothetical protein
MRDAYGDSLYRKWVLKEVCHSCCRSVWFVKVWDEKHNRYRWQCAGEKNETYSGCGHRVDFSDDKEGYISEV